MSNRDRPKPGSERRAQPALPARAQQGRAIIPVDEAQKVYGISAALAVMATRPDQVLRIAHTQTARKALAPALREAARLRIAYREVSDEELSRMAGSVHHEGVCLLAAEPRAPELAELARRAAPRGLLVALDQVANPHNVGAIVRSAAFFGAAGLVLAGALGKRSGLPPAAVRVAEGGAEHLGVARVPELADALRELKAEGMGIVGADAHASTPLHELRWPERAVLVLGSEDLGLTPDVRAACDVSVRIAGNGAIESLNVSVAAGVLIASYARA
jgi:TrmH RNA methyltransferase